MGPIGMAGLQAGAKAVDGLVDIGVNSLNEALWGDYYRDKEVEQSQKLEQRGTPIQIDPQKGETIEMKVRRITQNKEPITDVAQPIYMERGVKMASCDIRTDRWEVARGAKDKISAAVSEKYQKRAEAKTEAKAEQIGRAHV